MFKESKHVRRYLLLIGLGVLLSALVVMADCDVGIFPSTPKDGSGVSFNYFGGNTPMITPFLEDKRNCWGWTGTGFGNLYDVGGFNRKDACELMCDGAGECNLFENCTLFRGNSRECSDCEDDHLTADELDCTHDSEYDLDGDPCPGDPHDCDGKICKQDAVVGLFYPIKRVDLVFVVDMSGSMDVERGVLPDVITEVTDRLEEWGVDVEHTTKNLPFGTASTNECWAPGTEWVANYHPWRPDSQRIVLPVSDEGAYKGDPCYDDAPYINRAVTAANNNEVTVLGLYGDEPEACVISEMIDISSRTGGSAHLFKDKDTVVDAIINAVKCPEPFTTIDVNIYSHEWSDWGEWTEAERGDVPPPPEPETRKYCFLKGAVKGVTTFIIPHTDIDDTQQPTAEPVVPDEHIWRIEHPAFTIIETGNMPFKVVNPEFEVDDEGHVYRIKRVYWPDHSDSQKEFSVHSDLVFAYTLLESVGGSRTDATPLDIEATHAYTSMTLTNTYYVACDHLKCQGWCGCECCPCTGDDCCDCRCMDEERDC